MKKFNSYIILLIFVCFIQQAYAQESSSKELEKLIYQFKNPSKDFVLVAAHRGDWRNAPENSLRAVQNCIEMGVDIVEIDVRMTKDGQLIVMHDKTLERTSTGKGKILDFTLDSLRKLFLKNGAGMKTREKIPTLEELMNFVKGKRILVNLDKSWDYIPQTYQILKKTGTIQQGIFKGNKAINELRQEIGSLLDSIIYMPMVWSQDYNIYEPSKTPSPEVFVKDFITKYKPNAFEVILSKENTPTFAVLPILKQKNISIWINTLWAELCAGHDDDLAIDNPDLHWGWVLKQDANIIQTDRPTELLTYLRKKGLRK